MTGALAFRVGTGLVFAVGAVESSTGVRGQRWVVPIGENSTITIDKFPGHVELVSLNVVYVDGTRASGCPPLDVADLARTADAMVDLAKNLELISRVVAEVEPSRDITEIRESVHADPRPDIVEWHKARARERATPRVRDDDWYRDLANYRSEHGVAATRDKYSATSDRQVQRWLKEARRRGFTYKGMR